jgi:hypothetical protein
MKKLFTLLALLGIGVWIAGCGEEKAAAPKTPSPTTSTGPEAGKDKAGEGKDKDKDKDKEGGKAAEGETGEKAGE